MNDTKTYLRELREQLAHRLAGRFLAALAVFALSCAAAFAWATLIGTRGVFPLTRPTDALSFVRALTASAVAMLALYLSAHTAFSAPVAAAVAGWRGVCLGCAGGLMKSGQAVGIAPTWVLALTLYFAASVGVILTAAAAHVYSLGLSRAYADGAAALRRGIAREFLRLWLVLSGAVFLLGGTAVALV